jgi:hypothetical protein
MAAMEETKVMVMLRLTSPSKSSVQKLEAIPPGQTPITNSPKPIKGSLIISMAMPKANLKKQKRQTHQQ